MGAAGSGRWCFRPDVTLQATPRRYTTVGRAYSDRTAAECDVLITTSDGFSIDNLRREAGSCGERWQGIYEVNETHRGVTINIDIDVAAMSSPSNP